MNWINLIVSLCLSPSCFWGQPSAFSDQEIEKKIDQLMEKMSTKEKVGQTCQIALDVLLAKDSTGKNLEPMQFDPVKVKEAMVDYGVGSVLNVAWTTLDLKQWKVVSEGVHKPYHQNETNIPIIFGIDAIHGATYIRNSTLFPQEIGLAATWDTSLARTFAEITAYETRASGVHWNFSPVLDLGRQPLWSRNFETLGEDPFLASAFGKSIIEGYQGKSKIDNVHVASCMKHFVGYSNPSSGRDRTPAWIPDKYLHELYLPSFKAAVDAGALTVMINSGALNGVPGHINKYLITDLLKKEWGFKGFAVSDWEDFIMLHTVHRTATSLKDAIVQGINAGVDMSMVPMSPQYKEYCDLLFQAVEEGLVSADRLNDAVRRILRVKIKVGLFDTKMNQAKSYEKFASKEFQAAALQSALSSITLLENDGVLPLKKSQKVLVAGPTSNNLIYLNGAWTHSWQGADSSFNNDRTNVREELVRVLGKDKVLFSQGAELFLENGFETSRLVNSEDFKSKAFQADVIILCLGEYPSTEKPGDIRTLNLDEAQLDLAKMAYESGKPVVLTLLEGRPRIIREIAEEASAIVQLYLPGDYGAEAFVKLLYGEENFSGRLPYTYQRYDGQIEFYDRPRSVDRAKDNDFGAFDPQWKFGYGLSYSEVVYSDLQLSDTIIGEKDQLIVRVKVKNEGKMKVDEVVQLYLRDIYASLVPAGKKLKGFQKVTLNPGEIKEVQFELTEKDMQFVDENLVWKSEAGLFEISIDKLIKSFTLKK